MRTKHETLDWQRLTSLILVAVVVAGIVAIVASYCILMIGWIAGGSLIAVFLGALKLKGLRLLQYRGMSPHDLMAIGTASSGAGFVAYGSVLYVAMTWVTEGSFTLGPFQLFMFLAIPSLLGVFSAIPVRRSMVVQTTAPFATGLGEAEQARAFAAESRTLWQALKWFVPFGGGSFLWAFLSTATIGKAARALLPAQLPLPWKLSGTQSGVGFLLDVSLAGIGFLIGSRRAVSLLIGAAAACVLKLVLIPQTMWGNPSAEVAGQASTWALWITIAGLTSAGIVSPVIQMLRRRKITTPPPQGFTPYDHPDRPQPWFWVTGFVLATVLVLWLAWLVFGHAGMSQRDTVSSLLVLVLLMPLGVALTLVAIRSIGDTEFHPLPFINKFLMLVGVILVMLLEIRMTPLLLMFLAFYGTMQASSGGDSAQDFRGGYLLGTRSRVQVWFELLGVLVGSAVCAGFIHLMQGQIGPAGEETTYLFTAPTAHYVVRLAEFFAGGEHLSRQLLGAMWIAAWVAAILSYLESLDTKWAKWVPNPIALFVGIWLSLPFAGLICVGGFLRGLSQWVWPKWPQASLVGGFIILGGVAGMAAAVVLGVWGLVGL